MMRLQTVPGPLGYSDSPNTVRWLICASDQRWPMAVRRFAPELIPDRCTLELAVLGAAQVASSLRGQPRALVLWEVTPDSLGECCEAIAKTSRSYPQVVQLATVTELSPIEQAALSELGISIPIRHPEQLPKLAKMLRVYFAD